MSYIMVDVEADGPIPGDYSMICFGAIVVEPALDRTFYGRLSPISERWVPEALAVSGFSREETLAFDDPREVMARFARWIGEHSRGRPQFISDNNADTRHLRLSPLTASRQIWITPGAAGSAGN